MSAAKTLTVLITLALLAQPAFADGSTSALPELSDVSFNALGTRGRDHARDAADAMRGLGDRFTRWGELAGRGSTGIDIVQSALDAFQALSDLDDALADSIGNDGAGPEVPSSCAENAACNECFERAYADVNFVRNTLERLRTLSKLTIEYIQKSESFGDSMAGMTGIAALQWQVSKRDIEKERRNFNNTTREKYNQLIEAMRRNLQKVADCEQQHFNNPDWYNRYGFMYFNFIKEAYRPAD